MVAPYEIGDPVRSYVRVPGSGSDPTAKSLCCDLSRVSLVAAAAPIPQDHVQESPPPSPPDPQPVENSKSTGKCTIENVKKERANKDVDPAATVPKGTECHAPVLASKPPIEQDVKNQCMASNGSAKEGRNTTVIIHRKRTYPNASNGNAEERLNPSDAPPRKVIRVSSQRAASFRQDVHANCSRSVGINTAKCEKPLLSVRTQTGDLLSEVVRERDELRQQNIMLEHRLSLLKGIFKDKGRLAMLVKCLDG